MSQMKLCVGGNKCSARLKAEIWEGRGDIGCGQLVEGELKIKGRETTNKAQSGLRSCFEPVKPLIIWTSLTCLEEMPRKSTVLSTMVIPASLSSILTRTTTLSN